MFLKEKKSYKLVSLLALLGIFFFILYILFFADFTQVAVIIQKTDLVIYMLAFPFVITASVFDAMAWIFTLDSLSVKATFNKIFVLSWVGHFVDTIVPGGLAGDAFKTYLLTKEKGVNGSNAVASIVIKDVVELLVILGSLIIGIVLLVSNYAVNGWVMMSIGIVMILLALPIVLIVYLSVKVGAIEKFLNIIQRAFSKIKRKEDKSGAFSVKLHKQIMDFHEGVMSIKEHPKQMVMPIVCQTLAWVFELLTFFIVFVAIGSPLGFSQVVITNTIVSTVQGQGVAVAGISQLVSSELYEVLGITSGMAVASSLLAGVVSFWFKLLLSFGFFQFTVFERYMYRFRNFHL